jgi:hypothetical protein
MQIRSFLDLTGLRSQYLTSGDFRKELVMKVFRVAALVMLISGPAFAADDGPHINMMPGVVSKTQEEKDADAVKDRAYRESLRKIPDAKASADPWGTVRADAPKDASKDASKTQAKIQAKTQAKPRTKTGNNTK